MALPVGPSEIPAKFGEELPLADGRGTAPPRLAAFELDDAVDRPLRHNRDFQIVLAGQGISAIGDAVSVTVMPLLVLALTGSGLALGMVAVLQRLPDLLFGLPAGAYADRWDRRRMMLAADAGRAILTALIPLAALLGWPVMGVIPLVSFPINVFRVGFMAAWTASIPNLVGRRHLGQGSGLGALRGGERGELHPGTRARRARGQPGRRRTDAGHRRRVLRGVRPQPRAHQAPASRGNTDRARKPGLGYRRGGPLHPPAPGPARRHRLLERHQPCLGTRHRRGHVLRHHRSLPWRDRVRLCHLRLQRGHAAGGPCGQPAHERRPGAPAPAGQLGRGAGDGRRCPHRVAAAHARAGLRQWGLPVRRARGLHHPARGAFARRTPRAHRQYRTHNLPRPPAHRAAGRGHPARRGRRRRTLLVIAALTGLASVLFTLSPAIRSAHARPTSNLEKPVAEPWA